MTVIAAASVVSALLARGWSLATRPLWFDEFFTLLVSRLKLRDLVAMLRQDSGPPLFYLLERPIVLFTESVGWPDALARAISFLAAAALFAGALRLTDSAQRRWFLVLTATSPLFLIYAAEARAYALLALLLFALFLLSVEGEDRLTAVPGLVLLTAAALYTHYLALFAVAALLLVTGLQRRPRAAAGLLGGCLLFAPWVPVLLRQPREATDWIRQTVAGNAVGFLSGLGGAARVSPALGGPLPGALLAAGALAAILLAWTIRAEWRVRETRAALLFVALTLGTVLLVSTWRRSAFAGRTELAVLPVWIWAVAKGAARGRVCRLAAGAAAAVGLLSSALILRAQSQAASPYDAPLAAAARVTRPGDLLIAAGPFYLPSRLAAERGRIPAMVTGFPPPLQEHPGWLSLRAPSVADHEALRRAAARCSGRCRVLFLGFSAHRTPWVESLLAHRGTPRILWRRGDVAITAWHPPRVGAPQGSPPRS